MKKDNEESEAVRQYEVAYAMHYTTKDLHEAFCLYENLIVAHPETEEAKYSRSQIQNIVKAVVPKQVLFDAQAELVLAHFKQEGSTIEIPAQN